MVVQFQAQPLPHANKGRRERSNKVCNFTCSPEISHKNLSSDPSLPETNRKEISRKCNSTTLTHLKLLQQVKWHLWITENFKRPGSFSSQLALIPKNRSVGGLSLLHNELFSNHISLYLEILPEYSEFTRYKWLKLPF